MRLRWTGLPHLRVYRRFGMEPWSVGEVREVPVEVGRGLLEHGGFEVVESAPEAPAPDPEAGPPAHRAIRGRGRVQARAKRRARGKGA